MKYYKEFLVSAEPFIPEILSSVLWELDIQGINEEVGCLKLFASEESSVTVDAINLLLDRLKAEKMISNSKVEEYLCELKNWNEEWEKSLPVIHIDDKIIIKPTFREYEAREGEIVIEIDPKMSFGTGDHQTTKLVLQLMQKYIKPGDKVLDAGSGTAVLSIAAAKLGATNVTAFDIDEWSCLNGKENIELNNVAGIVKLYQCEINLIEEKYFNLILANIQKNILIAMAGEIEKRIKKNGVLILSGLLIPDEQEIIAVYSLLGFSRLETKGMDEWIAVVLRKTK